MTDSIFKKTICFALLGHIAVFNLFSFSFGKKLLDANYSRVSFWGSVLLNSEFAMEKRSLNQPILKEALAKRAGILLFAKSSQDPPRLVNNYYKPPADLLPVEEKLSFRQIVPLAAFPRIKREPSITLYPNLPYNFLLYFKDRQIVHIELMFNIISQGKTNYIAIKRKVASGNLEADLLSMRYMNHYLSVQQSRFLPNKWQSVKIELSPRND